MVSWLDDDSSWIQFARDGELRGDDARI